MSVTGSVVLEETAVEPGVAIEGLTPGDVLTVIGPGVTAAVARILDDLAAMAPPRSSSSRKCRRSPGGDPDTARHGHRFPGPGVHPAQAPRPLAQVIETRLAPSPS